MRVKETYDGCVAMRSRKRGSKEHQGTGGRGKTHMDVKTELAEINVGREMRERGWGQEK